LSLETTAYKPLNISVNNEGEIIADLKFDQFNFTLRHGLDPFIYYTELTEGSLDLGRPRQELFNYGMSLTTICTFLFCSPIVTFIIKMIIKDR